jgi:hypothetical protein
MGSDRGAGKREACKSHVRSLHRSVTRCTPIVARRAPSHVARDISLEAHVSSARRTLILVIALGCGKDDGGGGVVQPPPPAALTARHGHAMVYDEARRQLLLFGGTGTEGGTASADRNSLWRWEGTAWTRIMASGPGPRSLAALAYDASRQRVVLFGGQTGAFPNTTVLRDTWEWDGTTWTQRAQDGPSARVHLSIAYDRTRQRVVLYGGFSLATGQELRDIWEWNGTAWTQQPVSGPAGATAFSIAYDERTSAMFLFSSMPPNGALVADVWNGMTLARSSAATPPCMHPAAHTAGLGATRGGFLFYVHVCGNGPQTPQSWRWTGTAWTNVPGTQPPLRLNAALAYDRDRDRVVLYGGEVGPGVPDLADTWEFDGTTWVRR